MRWKATRKRPGESSRVCRRLFREGYFNSSPEVVARIEALGGTVVNSVPRYRSIRAELPLAPNSGW